MDEINKLKERLQNAETYLRKLVDQKNRLQNYKTGEPATPPPLTEFEKLDPCATRKQHRMKVFLQQLGVMGLWYAIYTNARQAEHEEGLDDQNDNMVNDSWQKLINDYLLGMKSRTLYYLMSIPEPVLMALVEGNLPSKMQEGSFRSKYASFLSLRPVQGVYVCYVGVAHQDADSQSATAVTQSEMGLGLNLKELDEVNQTMSTYCKNDHDEGGDDPVQARVIDTRYRCPKVETAREYVAGYRRYGNGQFDRILNFLETTESTYDLEGNRVNNSLNQIRLQRCFCYVGLGHKAVARATEHHSHEGNESALWGLFTATCKTLYNTRFSISDFTYQIIQTTREADIGLDEILVSVLASAYAFDGGLSAVHAGKQKGAKAKRDDIWKAELKESAKFYRQRGHQAKNISNSLQSYSDARKVIELGNDYWQLQQQLEAELDDLKIKNDEAIKYYGDLVAYLKLQIVKHAAAALKS